ncbi:transcriptional regulator, LysR family [Sphingobium sp. AP50]|nr:transcriptional regulator, LysR family [Sphingobium sp. AP50]
MLNQLLQVGSVSVVARRLRVSQPTVSRGLARLREIFDDPLFIRTNQGLQRRQRAEELLEPLSEWLGNADALFEPKIFDPGALEKSFRISATDSGLAAIFSLVHARLAALAPHARVDIQFYSDNVANRLASGQTDFVISGYLPDDRTAYSRRLMAETSVCVIRRDHPLLALSGGIDLGAYLDYPHVNVTVGDEGVDPLSSLLALQQVERKIVATIPFFFGVGAFLYDMDAIATVPGRVADQLCLDPRLAQLPAPAEIPGYDYWLLWHERIRRDPSTAWFVDLVADICRSGHA